MFDGLMAGSLRWRCRCAGQKVLSDATRPKEDKLSGPKEADGSGQRLHIRAENLGLLVETTWTSYCHESSILRGDQGTGPTNTSQPKVMLIKSLFRRFSIEERKASRTFSYEGSRWHFICTLLIFLSTKEVLTLNSRKYYLEVVSLSRYLLTLR